MVVPSQSNLYPSDVTYTRSHGSHPGLQQSPGLGSYEPPSTVRGAHRLNSYCPLKASFQILRVKLNAEKHTLEHMAVGVGAHGRNTCKPRTWEVEAGDSVKLHNEFEIKIGSRRPCLKNRLVRWSSIIFLLCVFSNVVACEARKSCSSLHLLSSVGDTAGTLARWSWDPSSHAIQRAQHLKTAFPTRGVVPVLAFKWVLVVYTVK